MIYIGSYTSIMRIVTAMGLMIQSCSASTLTRIVDWVSMYQALQTESTRLGD
jgi:hypothetical protein